MLLFLKCIDGYVNDVERNTPQAFSHFSYEVSGHQMLICDIQGVDDVYTDPQVHSMEEYSLSKFLETKGNLGSNGIKTFLSTHKCNPVCVYFRLPTFGIASLSDASDDSNAQYQLGATVPREKYMNQECVNVVHFNKPDFGPAINRDFDPLLGEPRNTNSYSSINNNDKGTKGKKSESSSSCCVIL